MAIEEHLQTLQQKQLCGVIGSLVQWLELPEQVRQALHAGGDFSLQVSRTCGTVQLSYHTGSVETLRAVRPQRTAERRRAHEL